MSQNNKCMIILKSTCLAVVHKYCIAGNIQGRILWQNQWEVRTSQRNLLRNAISSVYMGGAYLTFVEKTSAGGSQTAKFVKVFSLESHSQQRVIGNILTLSHLTHGVWAIILQCLYDRSGAVIVIQGVHMVQNSALRQAYDFVSMMNAC